MKENLVNQRHLLGSIDLIDVAKEAVVGKYKEESEAERKEYCAAISGAWPKIEKDLKELMVAQLMYSSNEAEDFEKVVFGRGTFNGLSLIYEKLKQANAEHMERSKPKEELNHDIIGQI